MAYRKFFYGDVVIVRHQKYINHFGHKGRVVGTHIILVEDTKATRISYRVACECGGNITPPAAYMDLIATPHEDPDSHSIQEIRMDYFLRRVGAEPKRDSLEQQVKEALATVRKPRDREIMSQRFGLDGEESRTLQALGDDFGVTKARIQQIEVRLIRKIYYALEKERHENRVWTPARQGSEPEQAAPLHAALRSQT